MSSPRNAVQLALIGAGNRGQGSFGRYALDRPHRARFVAVVEPDVDKRERFAADHGIPPEHRHADADAFFAAPPPGVEAVVVATLEDLRLAPMRAAMRRGWHILLEKPLGTNARELLDIHDAAMGYSGIIAVCHQMRAAPGYATLKRLVDSGDYGRIMAIQHSENVSYDHMAHSYVRGFFRNDRMTPMLLAKCCHDLDLLAWFDGGPARTVASFGSLKHFRRENAPAGAPAHCLDGCPAEDCPYHAEKIYLEPDVDPAYLRTLGVFADADRARLPELLRRGPHGRCVFRCDNNVVDSQTVAIQFADGVDVAFMMAGHNALDRRLTKISLTNGELSYDSRETEVRAWRFDPRAEERIAFPAPSSGHAGGDRAIMDNFTRAILSGDRSGLLTPIARSLEGHLLVYAAEASRATGQVVDVRAFEAELRRRPAEAGTAAGASRSRRRLEPVG